MSAQPESDPTGAEDLGHHGDADVRPGDLDFAVNVHSRRPPDWLCARLVDRVQTLGDYPSADEEGRVAAAVAAAHGRTPAEALPLAGATEGFHLLAALAARDGLDAAVVQPSYTEPERELRAAGVPVTRVPTPPPFRLDPGAVPEGAGVVVVGNPTNPTSVLHPAELVLRLCRPGRITVVDEAFADVLDVGADEPEPRLAGVRAPGLVVVRSLTKSWGLAGLRVGYAVGDAGVLARMAALRPHWPLGALQLEAIAGCLGERGRAETVRVRDRVTAERAVMLELLARAGVSVAAPPRGPFVLVRTPSGVDPTRFAGRLRDRGVAVRRCDTFPGLDRTYLRLAVRGEQMVTELLRRWAGAARDLRDGATARTNPTGPTDAANPANPTNPTNSTTPPTEE